MAVEIRSEMSASVFKVLVDESARVAEMDTVVILESMKMEIPIVTPVAGTVSKVLVAEGEVVAESAPLVVVENHA